MRLFQVYPGTRVPKLDTLTNFFFTKRRSSYKKSPLTIKSTNTYTELALDPDLQMNPPGYPYSFMLIPPYLSRHLCFELTSLLKIQLQSCPHSETDKSQYARAERKNTLDGILAGFSTYLLQLGLLFSAAVEPLYLNPTAQDNLPHCLRFTPTDFYPDAVLTILEELYGIPNNFFPVDLPPDIQATITGNRGRIRSESTKEVLDAANRANSR